MDEIEVTLCLEGDTGIEKMELILLDSGKAALFTPAGLVLGNQKVSKLYNTLKRSEQNGTFKPEKEI